MAGAAVLVATGSRALDRGVGGRTRRAFAHIGSVYAHFDHDLKRLAVWAYKADSNHYAELRRRASST